MTEDTKKTDEEFLHEKAVQWRADQLKMVEASLVQREVEIKKILPKNIDFDKFKKNVSLALMKNDELLQASRMSLFTSCMFAAQDGLILDGREAALVVYNVRVSPYGKKPERWEKQVQYMPMVKGVMKIMRMSADIVNIDAAVVYEKDKFSFHRGDDPKIVHELHVGTEPRGPVIGAYVIIKMADGEKNREFMALEDIEAARNKSTRGKSGPWVEFYDQMAIKTVIRRAAKQMPNIPFLDEVFNREDEVDKSFEEKNITPENDSLQPAKAAKAIENTPSEKVPEPVQKPAADRVPRRPGRLLAALAALAAKQEEIPFVEQFSRDDGDE